MVWLRRGAQQGSRSVSRRGPVAEFADYAGRIREASRSDARARAYSRVLFSAASDEVPDKQGRISVPSALREYAGLDRDCVVVGNHGTVEIWNPTAWDDYPRGTRTCLRGCIGRGGAWAVLSR